MTMRRRPGPPLTEEERKRLQEVEKLKAWRPRPDARVEPTLEEFVSWCEHPVTRYVAAAWLKRGLDQRDAWVASSWSTGQSDPDLLIELRTRADAYAAFLETGLEDYVKLNAQDQ